MKKREDLKVLLIQIRKDDMKEHEYNCFLRHSGLRQDQLISHDVFDQEVQIGNIDDYDAVIIGGSGEYSTLDEEVLEINEKLKKIIRWCYNMNFPYFGTCYGGQLAALALGGEVILDEKHQETGSYEVYLTPGAGEDHLFKFLPEKFWAQIGHKDTIVKLPKDATLLAYTKKCPVHAFTFPGKKFYATQFHAELDKSDLIKRVNYYKDYVKDKDEFNQVIREAKDSPEVSALPRLFIDEIVLK